MDCSILYIIIFSIHSLNLNFRHIFKVFQVHSKFENLFFGYDDDQNQAHWIKNLALLPFEELLNIYYVKRIFELRPILQSIKIKEDFDFHDKPFKHIKINKIK